MKKKPTPQTAVPDIPDYPEITGNEPFGEFLSPGEAQAMGRAAHITRSQAWEFSLMKIDESGNAGSITATASIRARDIQDMAIEAQKMAKLRSGPKAAAKKRSTEAADNQQAWRDWAMKFWKDQYSETGKTIHASDAWTVAGKIQQARVAGAEKKSQRTVKDAIARVKAQAKQQVCG